MQPHQHVWQAFAVARQPASTAHPGEAALDDPRLGSKTKPRLACAVFTTTSAMPCGAALASGSRPVSP
jgi:hypothetical protein